MTTAFAPRRLTHAEVEQIRARRGRSMLLFITDRCPVGCAHCSVDSRPDSPTIEDFPLFSDIVEWICAAPEIDVVGISGGEPFVERRGLSLASQRFAAAGKQQVIFTSGVWATADEPPAWIREILARSSCIYLSTDVFHARTVADDRLVRAARAIATAGAWIVLQVLDHADSLARAEQALRDAFGEDWAAHAEINPIVPLTNGRGGGVFTRLARVPGHMFGPCSLVRSPMVRYDGLVTACCNESVIQRLGPARLRRPVTSQAQLDAAVRGFHADPLLRVIGGVGLGALTEHPRFKDLAHERYADNCQMCWKVLDRAGATDQPDRLITLISTLETRE
ncbi:radical SAM protein [Nannocystis radixulma]|uniref:Radical SAM protein n=1 Tax=Nannocystis radixulma TaxID=2995305 RepID=A0ABT5B8X5_9BACT|nr:radical SAM protein [Nannocystis radixulma]MDC0670580.1 radical SAM protein [Nannocystis radixulma]